MQSLSELAKQRLMRLVLAGTILVASLALSVQLASLYEGSHTDGDISPFEDYLSWVSPEFRAGTPQEEIPPPPVTRTMEIPVLPRA